MKYEVLNSESTILPLVSSNKETNETDEIIEDFELVSGRIREIKTIKIEKPSLSNLWGYWTTTKVVYIDAKN